MGKHRAPPAVGTTVWVRATVVGDSVGIETAEMVPVSVGVGDDTVLVAIPEITENYQKL